MSKKFTKSQIEKIISEEISNIIAEKEKLKLAKQVGTAIKNIINKIKKPGITDDQLQAADAMTLKNIAADPKKLSQVKLKDAEKLRDTVFNKSLKAINTPNEKKADELVAAANKVFDAKSAQVAKNKARAARADAVVSGAALGTAGGVGVGMGLAKAFPKGKGTGAVSDAGAAVQPDPDQTDKVPDITPNEDPKKSQEGPSWAFSDDEVEKAFKKSETSKERRTRIAHATVKGDGKVESIKIIQKRLKNLGYDLGNFGPRKDGIDGDYGDTTVKAVKAFQNSNGLTGDQADGIVGNNTYKKLKSADAKGPSPAAAAKSASKAPEGEAAELLANLPPLFGKRNEILRKIYNEKGDDYRTILRLYTKFRNKIGQRLQSNARANDIDRKTRVIALNKALPRQGQIGVGPGRTGETNPERVSRKLLSRIGRVLDRGLVMLGNIYTDDSGSITPAEAYEDFFTAVFNDRKLAPIVYGYASDSIDVPELPTPTPIDEPGDSEELKESKKYNLNFDKWSKLWE